MKNKTWIYADSRRAEVNLHMDGKFFNRMRYYERQILGKEDEKIVVQIVRYADGSGDISICCWYWKKRENVNDTYGSLLFEWRMPYLKDGSYSIECNLPQTENWHVIRSRLATVEKKKPTKDNAFYYQNHIGYEYTPIDDIKEGEEIIKVSVDRYMAKGEAKATWKYIKKNNWVSKFYWDSWMHEYDCYCNFCKSFALSDPRRTWKSWVGNPDIGYVYPMSNFDDTGYKYKGKNYIPCPAELYDRLVFFNKEEYEEEIKDKAGEYKSFDELWNVELTYNEIASNGNVIGGAWRHLSNEVILAKEHVYGLEEKDYEKVVTLGWHRTNIKTAVRCLVCDDLYEIICRSDYSPTPLLKRIHERIYWKWEIAERYIDNFLYDLRGFLKHGKSKK